jgi:spore cortex formation protein SpoVR/YcgB (stage V sporulation)
MVQWLFTDNEWTFERLDAVDRACADIAERELRLETYPNQLEIITAEQMLDAYTSVGLPLFYAHWSFGKQHAIESGRYRRGEMGLAYELVINSNPCISYLMEENTMTLQMLVIAHAAYGHNAFFRNNALFQQWTRADSILDYLQFAQSYIADCEERYGVDAVSAVLDAAHALADNGIDRSRRPKALSAREEEHRRLEREAFLERQVDEIWRTLPRDDSATLDKTKPFPPEPEDNLLYFLEKKAPRLEAWKREILRIVRKIHQYLYPQTQTKIMNEGFACFVHYHIVKRLHETGQISDGAYLEFLIHHTNVVYQPAFDDPQYGGINPYALGFAIFRDIQRICLNPTDEDRRWFDFAGDTDWVGQVQFAMREFRDDSFVQQYVSPKVMRDLRLFALHHHPDSPEFLVSTIHDEYGYRALRETLAQQITLERHPPLVSIVSVDRFGDRHMDLQIRGKLPTDRKDTERTRTLIEELWGYPVHFIS